MLGLGNGSQPGTPPPRTESGFAPPPGPPPQRKNVPQVPPPGDFAPTGIDDEEENPFSDSKVVKPPFPKDERPKATGQFNDTLGVEPYHPGFTETHGSVERQDSGRGKVTVPTGAGAERDGSSRRPQNDVAADEDIYRY